ncbi:hypothetical protein [Nocardioides renjunii]|uniref:hypothetical protein n=1 Tax=Nocardioides renjunii TaxID=3095075 RepID=UPI002AFE7221|nr:hypothetical protein [Nocardioides sp. S-34]WQQ20789.1 hypothetical protein SHK17_12835 [Nocardioides sp. S-34]
MPSSRSVVALDPARSVVEQLRERVAAMEHKPAAQPVATLPGLASLVPLHAGATYAVDSASLALALAAGASQAGEWVGFAGCADFGVEAAAELGIELSRTVLVPDPGEHWLEVTAALVDVLRVVVLRPPASVDERTASVLDSRLRTRSAVLVVHGQWPRADARVSVEESVWTGPGSGAGQLQERRARVVVRRGARPPQRAELTWPGVHRVDQPVRGLRTTSGSDDVRVRVG